jgi:hypothetical protein
MTLASRPNRILIVPGLMACLLIFTAGCSSSNKHAQSTSTSAPQRGVSPTPSSTTGPTTQRAGTPGVTTSTAEPPLSPTEQRLCHTFQPFSRQVTTDGVPRASAERQITALELDAVAALKQLNATAAFTTAALNLATTANRHWSGTKADGTTAAFVAMQAECRQR